ERSRTLRNRVPRAGLEQPWRAGMIVRRAWPEHTELLIDLLVRDAGVVREATLRRDAQLVEDPARRLEVEAAAAAERVRDVLDDAPVLARVARRIDGPVDLDDAALDLRHGALVLLLERAREHDVGVARGLAQEELDRDEELELLERAR